MSRKRKTMEEEEDDTFYYRYSSTSTAAAAPQQPNAPSSKSSRGSSGGSGGLAPSKSTVYVSNIDFNLTNSDLHTIFSTFGKVAKVTILKDRATRASRGVAFVLFVAREDASNAARSMDGKILNGRTLRASIASDNGRASEFIRKRVYKDKSRCYECGQEGHLSYECPRNLLGPRERPAEKKGGKRKGRQGYDRNFDEDEDQQGVDDEGFEADNWASVVDGDGSAEKRLLREESGSKRGKEKKEKRSKGYFSDESGDGDDD